MKLEFTTKVSLPKDRTNDYVFLEDKCFFPNQGQMKLNKKEIIRITQAYINMNPKPATETYQFIVLNIARDLAGETPDGNEDWTGYHRLYDKCVQEVFVNLHQVFFKGEGLPESVYIYISPETYKTLYNHLWETPEHEEI